MQLFSQVWKTPSNLLYELQHLGFFFYLNIYYNTISHYSCLDTNLIRLLNPVRSTPNNLNLFYPHWSECFFVFFPLCVLQVVSGQQRTCARGLCRGRTARSMMRWRRRCRPSTLRANPSASAASPPFWPPRCLPAVRSPWASRATTSESNGVTNGKNQIGFPDHSFLKRKPPWSNKEVTFWASYN